MLADIIYANEHGKNSWDVLKSVRQKYEKGKLVKYKSACLCTLEHPINELVHVHELRAMISNCTDILQQLVGTRLMNWYSMYCL